MEISCEVSDAVACPAKQADSVFDVIPGDICSSIVLAAAAAAYQVGPIPAPLPGVKFSLPRGRMLPELSSGMPPDA